MTLLILICYFWGGGQSVVVRLGSAGQLDVCLKYNKVWTRLPGNAERVLKRLPKFADDLHLIQFLMQIFVSSISEKPKPVSQTFQSNFIDTKFSTILFRNAVCQTSVLDGLDQL